MTDARDNWWPSARRLWLWPVAILVGFPIGGLIGDLVIEVARLGRERGVSARIAADGLELRLP